MARKDVALADGAGTWPFFAADEIDRTAAVLRSGRVNYWTGGEGRLFEQEAAAAFDRRYAIALANGTLALELALIALDIGPGDEVVTTPRSYFASASSIALRGAVPVFADVDHVSQNITPATVAAVLSPRTRAVLCVHLAGWPVDMDGMVELASRHGLSLIEDCAQAHGAQWRDRPVGSFGDVAAFSFCQDKIITTGGEGGMLLMDEAALWQTAWSYKDHGKSWEAVYERPHPPGFRWLHEALGSNWRMTEMQAAIGRLQLQKLPGWVERRRRNAAILDRGLAELPALRLAIPPAEAHHAYYKYYAFVRPERLASGWSRDRIIEEVGARGIWCGSGACPEIYLEKAFRDRALAPAERLPVARELGATSLMFQVHPTLDDATMECHARSIAEVVREATG
jgi:dTDP-4-amino-4,6-dideoxygalactose transaminase